MKTQHRPWTQQHAALHPPMLRESLVEMIGNTPLVRLNAVTAHLPPTVEVWVKLEYMNPGGSIKDRAARQIILDALAAGALSPGQTLLDATIGNTGVAYAMLGAALRIPIELVIPQDASPHRRRQIIAYGAQIIDSPAGAGFEGASALAQERAASSTAFFAEQHASPSNALAHSLTTAPELLSQTNERITHFIAAIGSGGTLIGTGRQLKAHNPDIQVIGVMPRAPRHRLEGLRHVPELDTMPLFEAGVLDSRVWLDDAPCEEMAARLAREEGIMSGISGGANVAAALEVASTLESGVVVTLICDHFDRYTTGPTPR